MSSLFGNRLRVMTFGEAHGPAEGCVIDGCPAGLPLRQEHFDAALARDIPLPEVGTRRREPNRARILSGVFEGWTLGTPIAIVIPNEDCDSTHYHRRRAIPRPGHAEWTYLARFGRVDWRGGGRASGRECIARLAAGVVARRLLALCRVHVRARVTEMGGVGTETAAGLRNAVRQVRRLAARGESSGGAVLLRARGLPAGLGAPVFDKLPARLAQALMSIGGVKGVEVGNGREAATLTGSANNDPFVVREGSVVPDSNRAGGVLGGISTGLPLEFRLWVKPTPSFAAPQRSVDLDTGAAVDLSVRGRFDLNITPRVAVVAEAMTALVLADEMLAAGHIHPTCVARGASVEREALA